MKTAECYDGYHQTSRTEVSKTLTAGQGFGESSDSIPKVLVRTFNFELFANPPPETVGSLCRTRAGDWMCLCYDAYNQKATKEAAFTLRAALGGPGTPNNDAMPKVLCFRCGSFGQFVPSAARGTLECGHSAAVGNGTPCLVVQRPANSNGGQVMPCLSASEGKGTQGQKDADGGYVLVPFVKTSHARGAGGEGERWEEREVAGTRNVFDGDRPQEVVVHRPFGGEEARCHA